MRTLMIALSLLAVLSVELVAFAQPAKGAGAGATVELAPNLELGRKDAYRLRLTNSMLISIIGQMQTVESEMDTEIEVAVTESTASGATVTATFRTMKLSFEGQSPGSFDSADPEPDDPANIYATVARPIVGKPITLSLDRDGQITEVTGLDALTPQGTAGVLFTQLFGPEAVRSMLQPMFKLRDMEGDKATAKVGETWTVTRPSPVIGTGGQDLDLTLDSVGGEGAIARISFKAEPEFQLPENLKQVPDLEKKKVEIAGKLEWNPIKGFLRRLDSAFTARFETKPGAQLGLTLSINSETKLERLEK